MQIINAYTHLVRLAQVRHALGTESLFFITPYANSVLAYYWNSKRWH